MRGFTYLEDQNWIDREMTRGDDLPISLSQAKKVTQWLKRNYGPKIEAAVKDTPFPPYLVCAIACQETAIYWVKMIEQMSADDILAYSVYDASGDTPNDPRSAFPRNTSAFRAKYGDDFSDMLIEEANKTRKAMRGWGPKEWVYKGYGIFQYDLQAITEDKEFFREKQWYDIDCCLARVMQELKHKWARTHDMWLSVKAYNGSGSRAEQYMHNVQKFAEVTKEVWKTAPGPDPAPAPTPVPPVVVAATGPTTAPTAPASATPPVAAATPVAPLPAAAPTTAVSAPAATSAPAVAAVVPAPAAAPAALTPMPQETPMV